MNSSDNDNNGNRNRGDNNSSSSSSKKLLSKEVQGALKDRRDEQNLFARFKNVAADALERMSRREEEQHGGSGRKFRMGHEEARIIQNLNGVGLMEGAAAGILTFFVLRRGPIYVGRWVRRRQMAQYQQQQQPQSPPPPKDGYKLSDPNSMNSNNPFQRAAAAASPGGSARSSQEFPRSGSFVVRSIWFMFDVTLSLMMAASTSMAYTDTEKIRQQIIDMPLVEGTSLTSDALCDPIVQELAKIKQEKDPTYERLQALNKNGNPTPASTYLDNITKFSENCERRRYMERRITKEQSLLQSSSTKNDPTEIPSPGVPKSGPRLVVENHQEIVVHDDGTEEPFGDGFSEDGGFGPDMSWADDESNFANGSSDDRSM